MKSAKTLLLLALLLTSCLANAAECTLVGKTIDGKAFYQPGETAAFEISMTGLEEDGPRPAEWRWLLKRDNETTLEGTAKFEVGKPLRLEATLAHPGFVHVEAYPVDAQGKEWPVKPPQCHFRGGVGFRPEACRAKEKPKDFDAYWAKQRKRLAAVPLKPVVREVESKVAAHRCYAVTVPCAGPRPVTGYLLVPEGAKPASLPAVAVFHGYSFGRHLPPTVAEFPNAVLLNINPHGIDLDMTEKECEALKPQYASYAFSAEENANRDTAYFNGMALRVMRALEFLKTHPCWNGKELITLGASQGGMQSIWAAALDPQVTKCITSQPWCCDMGGFERGRYAATWKVPYTHEMDYYDPAIHARNIKAEVEVLMAGLGDNFCPPSGVAAFFNAIPGHARIRWIQGADHVYVPKGPDTQDAVLEK